MNKFTVEHAKGLYVKFCVVYGNKFVQDYHDDDFKALWRYEWVDGLKGIPLNFVKDGLEECVVNLKWPPVIAEFREICERKMGVPSIEDAIEQSSSLNFNHPVSYLCYEKIGSWKIKTMNKKDLMKEFKGAYEKSLAEFRKNPEIELKNLIKTEDCKKIEQKFTKIPSNDEVISFRERMRMYKKMADDECKKRGIVNHPEWEETKINPYSVHFDLLMYNERKKYLINLNEIIAITLPVQDKLDRWRFLNEVL